ncbi:SoxR-reducing system protein RseC [Mangrovibacter yixingensis]|uniref:SoxR-reducing system protein RseC n=1 Tax=Mangrovibacter yixingensis TaxID=1529639 RepID=UPI001CFCBFBA|nr:SoxR-reducing system protein RseC [Mangrovibacter yixingensis]
MIKEWATVISWQDGTATVQCDVQSGCSQCSSRKGCGSRVLNKLGPETVHQISVYSKEPLSAGQKVELGIAESSLLGSALLVYMVPLIGLFIVSGICQGVFASNLWTGMGAVVGGLLGFCVARWAASRLSARASMNPVILSIGLPPGTWRTVDSSPAASR